MNWEGMTIVGREEWGARPATSSSFHTLSAESILFVHYSAGQSRSIDTKAEQFATIHSIQNYHMDHNGWSDIGYHFIVFQARGAIKIARVFQGRPLDRVPAAQAGYNYGNIAVCVVAGPGEAIGRMTVNRIRSIYARVPAQTVKGHRDVNSTSCPGDNLYSKLPRIRELKR